MSNNFRQILAASTFGCALLLHGNVSALTEAINPAKDNTLYEDTGGTLSNGKGVGLFAGVTGQGRITRGLLMFDIAGQVPAGATITDATFSLHSTNPGSEFPDTFSLHRLTADWGEGDSVASRGGGGVAQPGRGGLRALGAKWSPSRLSRRNLPNIAELSGFFAYFGLANAGKLRTIRSLFGLKGIWTAEVVCPEA